MAVATDAAPTPAGTAGISEIVRSNKLSVVKHYLSVARQHAAVFAPLAIATMMTR